MKTIHYQNRNYTILGDLKVSTFLMYLVDESNPEDYEQIYQKISKEYQLCMISVSIQDWQGELSPWPAPAIFGKHDFAGNAAKFLAELEDFWKWFKDEHNIESNQVYLCGYSLAGLFTLWASTHTNTFQKIAAVSPSVWFLNFVQYMQQNQVHASEVYMSLGDKEANAKNKVMATVKACFDAVIQNLQKQDIPLTYEYNPGNHFQDVELRMTKGIRQLLL
jgi:hypothetical protein